jgi:hypothetical protein
MEGVPRDDVFGGSGWSCRNIPERRHCKFLKKGIAFPERHSSPGI